MITINTYALTGRGYTQQSITFDATGRQTGLTRLYADQTVAMTMVGAADGSSEVHSYDTAGRELMRILTAADGSKDFLTSFYAGTSPTPATVQQNHYAPGNQPAWVDVTAADGSHKQTAVAAGVSLTSNPGVVDTFRAAAAGSDTFVFKPAFGQDIVTNFHTGAGANHDTLDLSAFGFPVGPGQSNLDVLAQAIKQVGRDAIITVSPTDTITLKNTLVSAITKENLQAA